MNKQKSGHIGGTKTLQTYGKEYYAEIGKKGVEERKRKAAIRNELLSMFTVEDLENPVTRRSLIEKFEQLE